ncbi:MAG TPA: hypothetical protein VFC10_09345 [Terriglobia bacterium]|nr:hypothetical protein [Terriglobia bacterium]HZU42701.1 hypothetical protein [Terriglobales bacterium]
MTEETTSTPVTVQVRGRQAGFDVAITIQLSRDKFKDALSSLLNDLKEAGLETSLGEEEHGDKGKVERREEADGPYERLARELEVTIQQLRHIVGIKGETIQLYKASQFKIADAVCFICFVYEKGLGRASMPYETLVALVEASQIKMKTPVSAMCFNLRKEGYLQKRPYDENRTIVLSPEGEEKARRFANGLVKSSSSKS